MGKTEPIKVGKASPTEGTLPAAIYFIVKYAGDFAAAAKANSAVGGDNASRSIPIGMVMGAAQGVEGIPINPNLFGLPCRDCFWVGGCHCQGIQIGKFYGSQPVKAVSASCMIASGAESTVSKQCFRGQQQHGRSVAVSGSAAILDSETIVFGCETVILRCELIMSASK